MARCIEKNQSAGERDRSSSFHKGISGDQKNYFTARDREIFDKEAGDILESPGYERVSVETNV